MNLQKIFPFITLVGIASLLYLLHRMVLKSIGVNQIDFHYSLKVLYLFFTSLSFIILMILVKVKKRSFDNVGMVFMLATSVKMLFCYWMLRPILEVQKAENITERSNFFILFMVFLSIETLFTIWLVNKRP